METITDDLIAGGTDLCCAKAKDWHRTSLATQLRGEPPRAKINPVAIYEKWNRTGNKPSLRKADGDIDPEAVYAKWNRAC